MLCRFVFRRLDGSMSMANRDQAIIDFQEKPGVNILIVSLKAAALGLNLVAANHVVLLDLVILQASVSCSASANVPASSDHT